MIDKLTITNFKASVSHLSGSVIVCDAGRTSPPSGPSGRSMVSRVADENPHIKLPIAGVELPNGVNFEKSVISLVPLQTTLIL